MTFPQPSSTAPVLGGQQFFRLNTQLSGAGDLYESEVSALGFALGPDSDLASVRISRYDAEEAGGVSQFVLSPDRNFAGRIDSRPAESYIKSRSRKGRILIGTDDIYSPEWRPLDFDSTPPGDVWNIIPPQLDVMQYFSTLPSVIPPRSDRTFRFEYFEIPPANSRTLLAFPVYGRKSGCITVFNATAGIGSAVYVGLGAVRFALSVSSDGTRFAATEGIIDPVAALASFNSRVINFNSNVDGLWDYFYLIIGGVIDATPLNYTGQTLPVIATMSDDF